MGRYTTEQVRAIVSTARKVTQAAIDDPSRKTITIGAFEFDLLRGSRCAEFVRECVECALGWEPYSWRYRGGNATEMCAKLDDGGSAVPTSQRQPGCIIGINKGAGSDGHIAIYIGDDTIAENTSSATRGNPRRTGTKRTPWSAIANRVTGVYMLAPYDEAPAASVSAPRTWRFTAQRDPLSGTDITAEGIATQFDDKTTRTGIDASKATAFGCALPRGLCAATAGSPFVGVPDFAQVRVYCPQTRRTITVVVIDEGPSYEAKAGTGVKGSAMIDLTHAAAKALGLGEDENAPVKIRILGGTEARGREAAKAW